MAREYSMHSHCCMPGHWLLDTCPSCHAWLKWWPMVCAGPRVKKKDLLNSPPLLPKVLHEMLVNPCTDQNYTKDFPVPNFNRFGRLIIRKRAWRSMCISSILCFLPLLFCLHCFQPHTRGRCRITVCLRHLSLFHTHIPTSTLLSFYPALLRLFKKGSSTLLYRNWLICTALNVGWKKNSFLCKITFVFCFLFTCLVFLSLYAFLDGFSLCRKVLPWQIDWSRYNLHSSLHCHSLLSFLPSVLKGRKFSALIF